MQLLQISYKGKKPRTILLLLLSMDDTYITGLDVTKISDIDRKMVLAAKSVSIEWLKKNCPVSYRNAYRKLYVRKSKIIDKHEIGN
jgi:hypothetical protein